MDSAIQCFADWVARCLTVTANSEGWEGRQFMAVAASHLRSLHEREENSSQHSRLFSDHVNMTLCVSDAMITAHIGAGLQLCVVGLALAFD